MITKERRMTLRAACASVAYYLPGHPVTGEDINKRIYETTGYALSNGLIQRLTGVRSRYYRDRTLETSARPARFVEQTA